MDKHTYRDTIPHMLKNDEKEKLYAEYWQSKLRYEETKKKANKLEAKSYKHELKAEEYSVLDRLKDKQHLLGEYLHHLEVDAELMDLDLENYTVSLLDRAILTEDITGVPITKGNMDITPIGINPIKGDTLLEKYK